MPTTTSSRKSSKKKAATQALLVVLCIDGSGSMEIIKDSTIQGINDFIDGRRRGEGSNTALSLVIWSSSRYEQVHTNTPVGDVVPLNGNSYRPGGNTPLYDSMARAIHDTERALAQSGDKVNVLFVTVTDGQENASRENTRAQIFDLINRKQTEDGWDFLYIGANQDSYGEAALIAVAATSTANFRATPDGSTDMWRTFNGPAYDNYATVRSRAAVGESLSSAGFDYFGDSRTEFDPAHGAGGPPNPNSNAASGPPNPNSTTVSGPPNPTSSTTSTVPPRRVRGQRPRRTEPSSTPPGWLSQRP